MTGQALIAGVVESSAGQSLFVQITLSGIAVLLLALAIFVLRARRKAATHRWFAMFTIAVANWTIGVAGLQSGTHLDIWGRFAFANAALIPAASLAFISSYPAQSGWRTLILVRMILCGAGIISIASIATPLIVVENSVTSEGLHRRTGPLYPVFAAYFLFAWVSTLAVLTIKWMRATGLARARLNHVGMAFVISGAGAIAANLAFPIVTGKSTYSWIGPYFGLILTALVGHAIIRHRLMDLRLFVHSGLTFAIAMLLSLSPVAVALAYFWPTLAQHFGPDELLLLLAATIVVTLLAPPTRDIARRLLDRYVYRTRANYQRTVREASRALTRMLDLKRLLPFISTTVVEATGVEGVAIYLLDEDGFRLALARRRTDASLFATPERAPASVPAVLARVQDAVVADEVARQIVNDADRILNDDLMASDWALLLPVISDGGLIAFIAVGSKLSGDPFYSQDLDLLMTLANQAGIAIKNARLYAQVVLANEYIENIVATIESGVVAITSAGRVAMFNRAAERLTGRAADEIKGQAAAQLPPCLGDPLLASAADGVARTLPEIELPGPDRTRPVMCTTSPLRDPDGMVLGAVAVFSDLTPLKELEVERRRAERLAYFEVLASGIAHEIKNPLVAIKTFTQLLPRRSSEPQFVDDFGRIVGREIQRVERVVDRLRTLAHPGRRPEHAIDLRMPVGEALEVMQARFDEKRITVGVSLDDAPCRVLGDHQNLEQLFLNLLMNAHEATPPGGDVRVAVTRGTDEITVTVADTGPGIAPELRERIFEPFFTTKQRGSGLGLAISAGVAQAHGAKLHADNGPGGGATFSVEFPFAPVTAPVTA
jgi:PAS domain S-box-containing protein